MPGTLTHQSVPPPTNAPAQLATAVFSTQLGWMAINFQGDRLAALVFDHEDPQSAVVALPGASPTTLLSPLQQEIQARLTAFAAGERVEFIDIEVVPQWETPFASRVVEVCREIPYGETLSYGDVAAQAGSPGAARAVGNVMSSNNVPLVVPCHRVVGSHKSLGGYSARGGIAVKKRLLELEAD